MRGVAAPHSAAALRHTGLPHSRRCALATGSRDTQHTHTHAHTTLSLPPLSLRNAASRLNTRALPHTLHPPSTPTCVVRGCSSSSFAMRVTKRSWRAVSQLRYRSPGCLKLFSLGMTAAGSTQRHRQPGGTVSAGGTGRYRQPGDTVRRHSGGRWCGRGGERIEVRQARGNVKQGSRRASWDGRRERDQAAAGEAAREPRPSLRPRRRLQACLSSGQTTLTALPAAGQGAGHDGVLLRVTGRVEAGGEVVDLRQAGGKDREAGGGKCESR